MGKGPINSALIYCENHEDTEREGGNVGRLQTLKGQVTPFCFEQFEPLWILHLLNVHNDYQLHQRSSQPSLLIL